VKEPFQRLTRRLKLTRLTRSFGKRQGNFPKFPLAQQQWEAGQLSRESLGGIMHRFFHLLGVGLLASVLICAAFTLVWYALAVLSLVPFLQDTLLGRVTWLYGAVLYFLYALSLPVGQVYSFLIFRRRSKRS